MTLYCILEESMCVMCVLVSCDGTYCSVLQRVFVLCVGVLLLNEGRGRCVCPGTDTTRQAKASQGNPISGLIYYAWQSFSKSK